MSSHDGVKQNVGAGTDRTDADRAGGDKGDYLEQYRLGRLETPQTGVVRAGATENVLDFSQAPSPYAKPFTSDSNHPNRANSLELAESKTKIAEKPFDNFGYIAQPVYDSDSKAIAQTVEKYGSKLDYRQKQNLDNLISSTALGQTDNLKEALHNSTPEARKAYAEVMKKEMGLNVSLADNANGGFDLSIDHHSGLGRVRISQDDKWSPANVSSGWKNGKAMFGADPWMMTTDSHSAKDALSGISDGAAKYRREVGQTR